MNQPRPTGMPVLLSCRERSALVASVLTMYGSGDNGKPKAPTDDRARAQQVVMDINADAGRVCDSRVATAKFVTDSGGREACALIVPPIVHDLEIPSIEISSAEAEVEVDGPDLTSGTGTTFFVRDPRDATRWVLDEFS